MHAQQFLNRYDPRNLPLTGDENLKNWNFECSTFHIELDHEYKYHLSQSTPQGDYIARAYIEYIKFQTRYHPLHAPQEGG